MSLPFACSVYDESDLQQRPRPTAMGGSPSRGGSGGSPSGARAGAGAGAGAAADTGGRHTGATAGTGGASPVGGGPFASGGDGGVPEPGGVAGSAPGDGDAGAGAGGVGGSDGHAGTAGTGGAAPLGGAPSGSGGDGSGGDGEGGEAEPPLGGAGSGEGGAATEPTTSGLIAFYPCESASGDALADASGQGNAALLVDGDPGAPPGFGFEDGVVGKALSLSSSSQSHVLLPRGIVSSFREVTVATWVKLASNAAFQRIFDIGTSTDTFMYLSNAGDGGLVRFRITSVSPDRNQVLEAGQALPVGSWAHVAVTVGDAGVALYLDGTQVAQQAPAVMRPSDLGATTNNFIGRSPFAADPYLDGEIDEFRIYDRVLSSAELAVLAAR